jgi:hypothetical protein
MIVIPLTVPLSKQNKSNIPAPVFRDSISIQTRHIFLSIRNEFDLFFKIETEILFRNSAGATERIK